MKEKIFQDSSYTKRGSFPIFLTQTNEKEVTLKYILTKLDKKYSFKDYKKFTFTDLGAGEGTLTFPLIQFFQKKTSLETYCIEPSTLIDFLKEKCGSNAHYIKKGMEEIKLPKSDFILLSHAIQYLKNRKRFAGRIEQALNPNGKMLVVGTNPKSDDLKFKRIINSREQVKKSGKPKDNLFEYLEKKGFKITKDYAEAIIDTSNTQRLNEKGKAVISFFYHKPFSEISKEEKIRFRETIKEFAPKGKLRKSLQFIWVEK